MFNNIKNFLAKIKQEYHQRTCELSIGDEVEFIVKVKIAMKDDSAWVQDPGVQQVMYGPFKKPGEKYLIRGKVSSLSSYIHVDYRNEIPGYESRQLTFSMRGAINSFCCSRWTLKKVIEDNI